MSVGGSISGITFGGLSSGIDTDSIISRLIQLEQIPIQRLQTQATQVQTQQAVFTQFRTQLQSLNSISASLTNPLTFNPVKGTSSNTDVATLTATSGAPAGIYSLKVKKLAQAQKVASAAQADTSTALNKTGTFVVNGKGVRIESSDNLTKIAQKINTANAGVTASIIDGGAGRTYLTIASNKQGASNSIQMADMSGGVLADLGMSSGSTVPRETITNGITSLAFSSKTAVLNEIAPNSGLSSTSFDINGHTVSVDFASDSLQSIAGKITTAAAGTATASVRTITDSTGNTTYKLDIISGQGGDNFSDPNGVLSALGFMTQAPVTELTHAQDADFTLDGVALTSSSNTVTTAISGATLTLLKANETTPESSTITLTKDNDAIKNKIKEFTDSYNTTIDFITQYSQFDKDTFESGPLFGDPVAQQVESTVSNLVFNNVPGATGLYKNLSAIGVGVDDKGKLTVDDSMLSTAIANSSDSLGSLFQTTGTTTGANLSYVFAGNNSLSGSYDVNITSLPSSATFTAGKAQTLPTAANETLTFNGALFNNLPTALTIPQGSSQADIVNLINNDSRFSDNLVASVDGNGKLLLTGKKTGSLTNFTVSSDQTGPDGDNSGIGDGSDAVKVLAEDIKGTINGEPATGAPNGMLTGNTGNANTSGLQIQYTGNTLGNVGRVTIGKGMASMVTGLMAQFTDPVNGLLTTRDKALTDQYDDITSQITSLQTRLKDKQNELRTKFAAMEETITRLQQQGSQLSALKSG